MDAFFAAVRRFFRQHGEGLLVAATKDLDRVVEKLNAAVSQISDEIAKEYQTLEAERQRFVAAQAKADATVGTLSAAYDRAKRVSRRIAGLVE